MKRLVSRLFSRVVNRQCAAFPKPSRECGSSLEALESRIAPAALATFSKGTLLIQGDPDGLLSIEQTTEVVGANTVVTTTVTDNSAPLAGTSSFVGVKNIVVKLDKNATDTNQIRMQLARLPGSVEVLSPKTATTQLQIHGLAPVGDLPQIGKSVLLKGGAGWESLTLGGLEIGGGLVFPAGKGGADANIWGDVSIGSAVSLLGVNYVTLHSGAEIGGNLLITQKEAVTESYVLGAGAKVDGNVVIFAGGGSTTINAYADVGGRFFANAGQGANAFNAALTAKALQYVGGSSADYVTLGRSQITGSASFILSGGYNQVFYNIVPFDLIGDFSVGKNLAIGGGSGNDVWRLDSDTHNVSVGGKAVLSLGSGDNTFAWNGVSGGAAINISGSHGVDVVGLYGLEAPKAALNVQLGGGNDHIRMGNNFLKASLNGSSGTDTLMSGSVLPTKTKLKGFEVGV